MGRLLDTLRDADDRVGSPFTTVITIRTRPVGMKRNLLVFQDLEKEKVLYRPGLGLLGEFVELHQRGQDDLLRFAEKYGALGICVHGKAIGHTADGSRRCFRSDRRYHDGLRESANAWQAYVAWAVAILTISAKLRRGDRVYRQEWAPLVRTHAVADLWPGPGPAIRQQRNFLADAVSDWLDECDVRPYVEWYSPAIGLRLAGRAETLLGAIAVQVLSAVVQAGSTFCSACGRLYAPTRLPRKNQFHYCEQCKIKGKNRLAQRAFRQRHSR